MSVSKTAPILALDGTNLIHRAFYGVPPLNAPDGTPTNAVFGFVNILNKLRADHNPAAVVVCLDRPAPTFRHELYPEYKAGRREMPDELRVQLKLFEEYLAVAGVFAVGADGSEADDLMGACAQKCAAEGRECIIVTGDRDAFQLVTDKTPVLYVSTHGGKTDTKLMTPAAVEEKYGLRPDQLIDLKALMGDASDNIPGVAGIGEKTGTELLKKFGTLDGVYANIDSPDIKPAAKRKLAEGKTSAYMSRKLGTIVSDCDFDIDFDSEIAPNTAELTAFFRRLGFKKFLPPEELNEDQKLMAYVLDPAGKIDQADPENFEKRLRDIGAWDLYENIEKPLTPLLRKMEAAGFAIDRAALKKFSADLGKKIDILVSRALSIAGKNINLASPKQLGACLFEDLGLPHGKKTKTGWSVDAETLRGIDHPIIGPLLEYRELTKLKSTYADGLANVLDEEGHVHTKFRQTDTVTGRLSSAEPNLQNIPVRRALGAELRRMFIPSEPNFCLVDADYSQIELRVLAHIAGDSTMREAFRKGDDIHAVTASQVFNVKLNDVTAEQRRRAKAVNFGIVYGISDFSLARDIGVSRAEAGEYINGYLAHFSGVKAYMKDIVERAKRDGYVTTLLGRRRYLPEISSANYNIRSFGERAALNTPIQGTAADIIKMAMLAVDREIAGKNARLILQVHDELIVECHENCLEETRVLVKKAMENVFPLDPPLVADVGTGKTWYDAK